MAACTDTQLQDRWLTGHFVVLTPKVGVALVPHEHRKRSRWQRAREQTMQWRRGLLAQAVAERYRWEREFIRAPESRSSQPLQGFKDFFKFMKQ